VRRKIGRNWIARCPSCAAADRDKSGDNLAISVDEPQKYICWAGCTKEMIRSALGCPIPERESAYAVYVQQGRDGVCSRLGRGGQEMELEPANWKPLERLIGERCAEFMWMWRQNGLEYYKHIDTRRYLILDAEGRCYGRRDGDLVVVDFGKSFAGLRRRSMSESSVESDRHGSAPSWPFYSRLLLASRAGAAFDWL
jgi:hypothetical protein